MGRCRLARRVALCRATVDGERCASAFALESAGRNGAPNAGTRHMARWPGTKHPVTSLLLGALTAEDTLHLVQGLGGDVRSQRSRELSSNGRARWSEIRASSAPPVEELGSFLFAE